MQPLQCYLQDPAAKGHSITHAAAAPGNLDATTTMRSADAAPNWISTPKRKKDDFEALFKRNFKGKIASAKIEKICWQITVAALMQPLQYYLQDPAAKDNSITHGGRGTKQPWRSHYNAICRHWIAKHKSTTRNGIGKCSSKTGFRSQSKTKHDFEAFFKRNFTRKIAS